MEMTLDRYASNADATLGILRVGREVECFILEDQHQAGAKVYGETRIPEGIYDIKFRDAGGMNTRYHERFPDTHRGMLHLQDVPGFEWIYIHPGNTDDHSLGCLLPGQRAELPTDSQRGSVMHSTDAYLALYAKIAAAVEAGETCQIFIRDCDR